MNEVFLIEEMYCMHLARKNSLLYLLQVFEIKTKPMAGGGLFKELKYLVNAIDIVDQFETDLD